MALESKRFKPPSIEDHEGKLNALFLGSSGEGKSHLMVFLWNKIYYKLYDRCIVMATTLKSPVNTPIYSKMNELFKGHVVKLNYFNIDKLAEIEDSISMGTSSNTLIIIDDAVHLIESTKRQDDNVLSKIINNGRHKHISLWLASQVFKGGSTTLRSGTNMVFCTRFNSMEQAEKVSVFSDYSKKEFLKKYTTATKKKYGFVSIYQGVVYNKFGLML